MEIFVHRTFNAIAFERSFTTILDYGQRWAITFNTTKTIQQTFSYKNDQTPPTLTFGGDPIPVHDEHTHLGITFSTDLRFHKHINRICQKVNKMLSPPYNISKYIPRQTLDQIYKTYVRPHFDYCDTIYDGHITVKDSTRLETLQHRAARLVTGGLYRTPRDKLLLELGWDKLATRRHIHRLTLYHKLSDPGRQCPSYITELMSNTRAHDTNRQLRNTNKHTTFGSRTTLYHKSFFPLTCAQWNKLPNTTQHLKHNSFKKKQLCEQLGLPDPPLYNTFGSKIENVLHARLIMEMTHLNSHLFIVKKTVSPSCSCGHRSETINHFVLQCPYYKEQRESLFQNISPISKTNLLRHN